MSSSSYPVGGGGRGSACHDKGGAVVTPPRAIGQKKSRTPWQPRSKLTSKERATRRLALENKGATQMIAYSKAYPHAEANGRLCPFPALALCLAMLRAVKAKDGGAE